MLERSGAHRVSAGVSAALLVVAGVVSVAVVTSALEPGSGVRYRGGVS